MSRESGEAGAVAESFLCHARLGAKLPHGFAEFIGSLLGLVAGLHTGFGQATVTQRAPVASLAHAGEAGSDGIIPAS